MRGPARRAAWVLGSAIAVVALVACEGAPRVSQVVLAPSSALGCRPTDVERVEVRALGDFPASSANVISFDPGLGGPTIDRFPDETELLAVEAFGAIGAERWEGGGLARVVEGDVTVPLLRYGRACPIADPRARIPRGAATAALPDGRTWIAGGADGAEVLSSILTLQPGASLASPSASRLFVKRAFATASVLGDSVVVVGGSAAVDGPGEDTFEVLDIGTDARVGEGFLLGPRREHAAIVRGDQVVISGGRRRAGGPPLGELEVLQGSQSVAAGSLDAPRAGHAMLALDDGSVAIVGGVDAEGEPVTVVERLGVDGGLEVVAAFEPPRAEAAYVALPGSRIARVGGREGDTWTGQVDLLLEHGELVSLGALLPALAHPVAAAVGDAIVVVGADPVDGRARGAVLDPDAPPARPIQPSRPASLLLSLSDGSFIEGSANGLALLRVDATSPLDPPPASIAPAFMEDREALALDAAERWRAEAGVLRAREAGARFDVPTFRFADLAITLDASAAVELLLVLDDRPPLAIVLTQASVMLGDCRVSRHADAPLRVLREGNRVTLDAGGGERDCPVALPERIGVALRALEAGAGVRLLELERR